VGSFRVIFGLRDFFAGRVPVEIPYSLRATVHLTEKTRHLSSATSHRKLDLMRCASPPVLAERKVRLHLLKGQNVYLPDPLPAANASKRAVFWSLQARYWSERIFCGTSAGQNALFATSNDSSRGKNEAFIFHNESSPL